MCLYSCAVVLFFVNFDHIAVIVVLFTNETFVYLVIYHSRVFIISNSTFLCCSVSCSGTHDQKQGFKHPP